MQRRLWLVLEDGVAHADNRLFRFTSGKTSTGDFAAELRSHPLQIARRSLDGQIADFG